jgi:hypothetical protein
VIRAAILAALLTLPGCTSTTVEYQGADGARAMMTSVRLWTDTSANLRTPDGLEAVYTSNPDGAQLQAITGRLLDAVVPLPVRLRAPEPDGRPVAVMPPRVPDDWWQP